MNIPKVNRDEVLAAMEYIDQHGVPAKNKIKDYILVSDSGKAYPPKYAIAVAEHSKTGKEIDTNQFGAIDARKYLQSLGFKIETKEEFRKRTQPEKAKKPAAYKNKFSPALIKSRNIIFRGAPGTGKTYLAKQIAADIISDGAVSDVSQLSEDQLSQVEFVQFHPGYDYSDFVEGLRPTADENGSMGFELRNGTFKEFVDRARRNWENSQKTPEELGKEATANEAISEFFDGIDFETDQFQTKLGHKFLVTDMDDKMIRVSVPGNSVSDKLSLSVDKLRKMLEADQVFEKPGDLREYFNQPHGCQADSYLFALYKKIKENEKHTEEKTAEPEEKKNYVFIIDEINRGEINKIFGELFYSVDPGYRGPAGAVSTQYSNMHADPNEKFFIPENVYIIGTMNDIDRSVDTFDFAMRRRFRFTEVKPEDRTEMLDSLDNENLKNEAIQRMNALNKEIVQTEGLNRNYQIGPAYFLKLKHMNFDELWTDDLEPLLEDYISGIGEEEEIMKRFAKAYGYNQTGGTLNEAAENQ